MRSVTIRTKEPEPPEGFPPVRLFLDDIQEIVRTLVDDHKKSNPPAAHEDAKIKVTFTIKDQVCDEVEELPKIAKKTTELSVQVESKTSVTTYYLRFARYLGSTLDAYGLTEEEHRRLFHKLAPIFKRRNLWFRTHLWSHYMILFGVLASSCIVAISLAFEMLKRAAPNQPMKSIAVALLGVSVISTFWALWSTLSWHSIIILRHSSEPSPLRQELLHKFPLVAFSSVLTFLLTLLGLYLKHKYWP